MQTISRSRIIYLAWPILIANLSTPLLGLVDTAVIGHLGNPAFIGAIAISGTIFSFLYWGFGFLRMGTTGLVAQAKGENNHLAIKTVFYRAFFIGLALGFALLLLQSPLISIALYLIDGTSNVESAAQVYFDIRIWSSPFNLASLAIAGFLLGQQKTTSLLAIQLILNGTNIILDLLFVVALDLGVAGAAYATLIAEILAFGIGLYLVISTIKTTCDSSMKVPLNHLLDKVSIKRMFSMNRDIMIRTLCLLFAFAWFTNQGAQSGDVILAANAILMQLVTFSAFFLDGFALTAETLVGRALGARQLVQFKRTAYLSFELGFATALALSIAFYLLGPVVINLLTNIEQVQLIANTYLFWAVLAPLLSVSCYLLDGIFIGATQTQGMRNAMVVSLLCFLASCYILTSFFGNQGLWAALEIYFLVRAISLAYYWPRLIKQFSQPVHKTQM